MGEGACVCMITIGYMSIFLWRKSTESKMENMKKWQHDVLKYKHCAVDMNI